MVLNVFSVSDSCATRLAFLPFCELAYGRLRFRLNPIPSVVARFCSRIVRQAQLSILLVSFQRHCCVELNNQNSNHVMLKIFDSPFVCCFSILATSSNECFGHLSAIKEMFHCELQHNRSNEVGSNIYRFSNIV